MRLGHNPKSYLSFFCGPGHSYLSRTRAAALSFEHHTKGERQLYQTILIKKDQMLLEPHTHDAHDDMSWDRNDQNDAEKETNKFGRKKNYISRNKQIIEDASVDDDKKRWMLLFVRLIAKLPKIRALITFSTNSTNWLQIFGHLLSLIVNENISI